MLLAEGIHGGLGLHLLQLTCDYGVVVPVNESVARGEILQDAEFGIDVVLHLVFVAVEMVGRDVHKHGYVGPEVVHVFELERTELHHIYVVMVLGHLPCQRAAHIAGQSGVHAGLAQDMIDEHRGGRLAV